MQGKNAKSNRYRPYVSDLHGLLNDIGLSEQPMRIWNIDETRLPFLHKPVRELGQTGTKNIYIQGRVGNNRENRPFLFISVSP